eukprot:gene15482-18385_t
MSLYTRRSFNRSPPIFKTKEVVDFKLVLKLKRSAKDNWKNGRFKSNQLIGHTDAVSSLAFNGTYVVSSSYDSTLKIWDYQSGLCRHTIPSSPSECMEIDYSNHRVITGSKNGNINIWDIESGTNQFTEKAHYGPVTALKGNYNSTVFCSGSKDNTVKLWDVASKKLATTIRHDMKKISGVEWCTQDRNHLFLRGGKQIGLLDAETGQTIRLFSGHINDIHCFSAKFRK